MKGRLLSIDVLRGLTIIFMIIVNQPGSWDHVYAPLLHAKWNGLTPTDYIFPLFLDFSIVLVFSFFVVLYSGGVVRTTAAACVALFFAAQAGVLLLRLQHRKR